MVAYSWLTWCIAWLCFYKEVVLMSILIYLATIFWSLFPNLIHVFQGGDDFINKVNETNLVSNGDLSLDTNSDNIPDGFSFSVNTTDKSLVDDVAIFTPTSQFGRFQQTIIFNANDLIYYYSRVKSDSNLTYLVGVANAISSNVYHSGNNDFEFLSNIQVASDSFNVLQVGNSSTTSFTPILVDYIGSYNVSTMKLNGVKSDNGIPFSELTNEQIKTQLDTWIVEYGDLSFTITKDNTFDSWFNSGFVDKQAERDFLDYLGYFVWLTTPPIMLFITLDLIRRLL